MDFAVHQWQAAALHQQTLPAPGWHRPPPEKSQERTAAEVVEQNCLLAVAAAAAVAAAEPLPLQLHHHILELGAGIVAVVPAVVKNAGAEAASVRVCGQHGFLVAEDALHEREAGPADAAPEDDCDAYAPASAEAQLAAELPAFDTHPVAWVRLEQPLAAAAAGLLEAVLYSDDVLASAACAGVVRELALSSRPCQELEPQRPLLQRQG